jgi:hypothetical protein
MRDLYSNLTIRRAISPVSESGNTALVSQVIDRQGYESLVFAIATGSIGDADATFAVLVEDDDDAAFGTGVAVVDAELNGTEAAAGFQFDDDNEVRKIGYRGNKRYVRLTITPSANASAALISAVAILGHPALSPAGA